VAPSEAKSSAAPEVGRTLRRAPCHAPIAQRVERPVEAREAAGSRPARCTTSLLASSSVGRALRCYRSRHRFESCLASHTISTWASFRRDGRAVQGIGLLNRRGRSSRVGSNPTLSANLRTQASERARAALTKQKSLVQPKHHTCDVSSAEQSPGLRSRWSKVRVLHVAPDISLSSPGWTRTSPSHGEDWGSTNSQERTWPAIAAADSRRLRWAKPQFP
jgi:hypothetical protein